MQRRTVAIWLGVLLLAAVGASSVAAQDDPPAVGQPVPIADTEGVVHGTVTVKELADPYTGFDPNYPAAEGMRYVTLTVTYEAAPDQSFDAQPYQVVLQSADGYLFYPQYVPRPADSKIPDLQGQLMAPDNRISGVIGYVVPAETVIDKVVFSPSWDRLSYLADLGASDEPVPGDAVTYTNASGAAATVATELMDPFTAFDPAYPPAEGMRYVAVHAVFEDGGGLPYYADPWDIYLRDGSGLLIAPASVYLPVDTPTAMLEGQTINPGDRISGYVAYVIPADARISDVLYYPESNRVVSLGHAGGSAAPSETAPSETEEVASPAP